MPHTPGPWLVHKENVRTGVWEYQIRTVKPHNPAGGVGKHIATCNMYIQAKGEDNASLMAAAPDLLAACKAALGYITDPPCGDSAKPVVDLLRAAIAEAGGAA